MRFGIISKSCFHKYCIPANTETLMKVTTLTEKIVRGEDPYVELIPDQNKGISILRGIMLR